MKFRVSIAPGALAEAIGAFEFIYLDSPGAADRWFGGLLIAIDSLERYPRRFPRAPQSGPVRRDIREMLYKSHRVFFAVVGREVRILHIRHGARLPRREP